MLIGVIHTILKMEVEIIVITVRGETPLMQFIKSLQKYQQEDRAVDGYKLEIKQCGLNSYYSSGLDRLPKVSFHYKPNGIK